MRLVARLDPVALEAELLDRLDRAHPRSKTARSLILVPTARMAAHLERRLADRRSAWLGVHVLDFTGLAREILHSRDSGGFQIASNLLLDALVERIARDAPQNPWVEYARRRPGTMRRLRQTLNDLREAGIAAEATAECLAEDPRGRGLAEIHAAYERELERARSEGWSDRAGVMREAARLAPEFATRFDHGFVHGAYEWIGVNLDLMRAIDPVVELQLFVPASPGRPVSKFADRFAERHLGDASHDETRQTGERDRPALEALYDEGHRPSAPAEGRFRFRHAQGATDEVRIAVRRALADVAGGCPPEEIAIVARNLADHGTALEAAFEEAGLPWSSSISTPLGRHPLVRDFLLALRVVEEDFPRGALVELLGSRRLRGSALVGPEAAAPRLELADRVSRQARLIGGFEEWTHELPAWAAEAGLADDPAQTAEIDCIADTVRRLRQRLPPESRTWSAHASHLERVLEELIEDLDETDAGARESLRGLFDEMARRQTRIGDAATVGPEAARAWLEQAVRQSVTPLHPRDRGGIRVLDAMQARGLTFEIVHLLGVNGGVFPRTPRADPILTDRWRSALAERTARPLVVQLEAVDEERLLLALVVGSARTRIDVSWQRADEQGKPRTPSLAIRELARLCYGTPDTTTLRREAWHAPAHPTRALEALAEDPGLLSPDEERMLVILSSRGSAEADRLIEAFPELAPGLTMLRATQLFEPPCGAYDGRIGARTSDRAVSVSAYEKLGRCPLQYFFSRVLRVPELDDEATVLAISRKELGLGIHALLERTYRALDAEGLFDPARSVDLVKRGLELLDAERERLLGTEVARPARRLPLLWERVTGRWFDRLRQIVAGDLTRIQGQRLEARGFEESRQQRLDLGSEVQLELRARFDCRFEGPEGAIVRDYKTSRNVAARVNPTRMLKGLELQVPLYTMLAGEGSAVEILGVHPDLDPADAREEFKGFADDAQRDGFRATLRELASLRSRGVFPLRKEEHCTYCAYRDACRRNHPPTVEREAYAEDSAGYRRLGSKSTRKPHG